MTAIPETHDREEPGRGLGWVLKLGLAGLLAMFALGGAVGASVAAAERGLTPGRIAVVAGFALAAIAGGFWLAKLLRRAPGTAPESRRVATARRMVVLSGAIGGVLGLLMAVAAIRRGGAPSLESFANTPLPPLLAAALIGILVLVVPITWIWHRSIDEHESAAYRLAALIALYAYFWVSAVWWLAARGGLLPAPNGIAIFFVTVTVWGLGWAWARFR